MILSDNKFHNMFYMFLSIPHLTDISTLWPLWMMIGSAMTMAHVTAGAPTHGIKFLITITWQFLNVDIN